MKNKLEILIYGEKQLIKKTKIINLNKLFFNLTFVKKGFGQSKRNSNRQIREECIKTF